MKMVIFGILWSPILLSSTVATETAVGDAQPWLKEQDTCVVTLYNGSLSVTPPIHVELEIVEQILTVMVDTVQGGSKPARLVTGATVKVPLFLDQGEVIQILNRRIPRFAIKTDLCIRFNEGIA